MINIKIIAICISFMFFSCKKDFLIDVNQDFEGEWHSTIIHTENGDSLEKYMIINENYGEVGEWCKLGQTGSDCGYFFSGDAKITKNKKEIQIGPRNRHVDIEITIPPHINENGDWECTLTSLVYIRN